MSLCLTAVTALSSFSFRYCHHISSSVRIIVQMTIIASLVIDLITYTSYQRVGFVCWFDHYQLYCYGKSGRLRYENPPMMSFMDGIGNGLGYGMILMTVGFFRELFGSGTLFGYTVLSPDWYQNNGLLLLPPSAFFIIGLIIWVIRTKHPEQVEAK